MTSQSITNGILKALAIIIGTCLVLYFLYQIQAVIVYVIIAGVISLIGRPLVLFLRRRLKFKNTLAVVTVMILFVGLFIGLISMFVPLVVEQGKNLSLLDTQGLKNNIRNLVEQTNTYFASKNINLEKTFQKSSLAQDFDLAFIPNFLNEILESLGSFSVGLFSVLFITFFFLKDNKLFENGILTFVPSGNEEGSKRSFNKIKDLLSRYFVGLVFQILILFIIYTIVLLIFDINNAVVIAFLCALINLVPYVGPLVSGVIILILSMTSNLGESFSDVILPKTLYVMIGFFVAQLIDNFFSQPIIFSKSVKSHPLEIFLVILISGIIFGIVGMIVAIPLYTSLKVILKEFLSDNKIVKRLTKEI